MKRILVVEDELDIREILRDLLEAEGFKVLSADNGLTGLKLAREQLPDLIISDILMPKMDGYGLLNELRRDPMIAMIPFIFLTAKTNRAETRHGMDLGADDYLTKPFFPADLYNAIESRFARQSLIAGQFQKKLDDLRQNITAALPHELRTPLTGILAGSALLRERYTGPENEEIHTLADLMYQSAERLNRLVQNSLLYALLAVFRSDDKALAQMRADSTTDTNGLIAATAQRVAQRAGREADLLVDAQSTHARILEEHFVKIVEELIDNAFKYSRAGSPVQVTSFHQDHYLQLWITDSGHGMSAAQIADVGAYAQFDRKLYEQQGTGLGLVLAQQLAEIYEGELSIDSKPGGPTTVHVTLPE